MKYVLVNFLIVINEIVESRQVSKSVLIKKLFFWILDCLGEMANYIFY